MPIVACFTPNRVPELWLQKHKPVQLIVFSETHPRPGIHREQTSYGEKIIVAYPAPQWKKEYPIACDILFTDEQRLTQARTLQNQVQQIVGLTTLLKNYTWSAPHTQERRFGQKNPKQFSPTKTKHFLIIGAGLSGAFLAHSLRKYQQKVTIIDAGMTIASQASALYAGLMHPHWQKQDHPLFALTRHGYHRLKKILQNHPDCFIPTGCLEIASSDLEEKEWKKAQEQNIPYCLPADLVHFVDRSQAEKIAGFPVLRGGWFYPRSGLVKISRLCRALLKDCTIVPNTNVTLHSDRSGQIITYIQQQKLSFDHIICATAYQTLQLLGMPYDLMPIDPIFGRISILASPQEPQPQTAVTGSGYFSSIDGFYALGATYEKDLLMTASQAHQANLQQFSAISPVLSKHVAGGFYQGIRAIARDRLPIVGAVTLPQQLQNLSFAGVPERHQLPVASNLWICTAMGSRGITWGSILAENLVRTILQLPPVLPKSIEKAVDPQRFLIQAYKKTKGLSPITCESSNIPTHS